MKYIVAILLILSFLSCSSPNAPEQDKRDFEKRNIDLIKRGK